MKWPPKGIKIEFHDSQIKVLTWHLAIFKNRSATWGGKNDELCDDKFLILKMLFGSLPQGTYKVSRAQAPSFVTPEKGSKGSHVNYLATGANWNIAV